MTTDAPQLATTASDCEVWRVGFQPEPGAWPSWQYATDGRFPGRWDDADGNFRTITPAPGCSAASWRSWPASA